MRFLVCMSGASGSIYGVRLLEVLGELGQEVHFIASELAKEIVVHETGLSYERVREMVEVDYDNLDLFAAPASGSFHVEGMVIIPCSMKTLSAVANGYSDNLISRAALCQLKEGRPLLIVVRETPIDLVGLRNMVAAREAGAVILPANPGFYHDPKSISDLVDYIIGKVLDQLKVPHSLRVGWKKPGN